MLKTKKDKYVLQESGCRKSLEISLQVLQIMEIEKNYQNLLDEIEDGCLLIIDELSMDALW